MDRREMLARRERHLRRKLREQEKKVRRDVDRVSVQFSNLFTSVVGLTGVMGVHKIFFRRKSTFSSKKKSFLASLMDKWDKKSALRRTLEFSIGYLIPVLVAFLQRVKKTQEELRENSAGTPQAP